MATYIIAEIGQNHNGDIEIAEKLIDLAAMPVYHYGKRLKGADAVKFTVRDLNHEMTPDEWNRPYNNKNSYGDTYGEHRKYLEIKYDELEYLYQYSKAKNIDFILTVCNPGSLRVLDWFKPDKIKIASRDLTNIILLKSLPKDIPIIISTGMHGKNDIVAALNVIKSNDISVLHCVSAYPGAYEDQNLLSIKYLDTFLNPGKEKKYKVGFSDHTTGVLAPSLAVALGAQIIEKHITLDREGKGSDHLCSMGVPGFMRVVRDIRNTELSLGKLDKIVKESVSSAKYKLERSLAWINDFKKGTKIDINMIIMVSPGFGYKYNDLHKFLGKKLAKDVKMNEHIRLEDVE